jgi:formate-dependent nitrite reductase membrane component NrfD
MKPIPYQWMTTYTPQREWIEGRGLLLWLSIFFVELGAGLYLVSVALGGVIGMILGYLLALGVGGGLHIAYLGRPTRVWRAFSRPGTSWISRGLILITLFMFLGAFQLLLELQFDFAGAPGESIVLWSRIAAGLISFAVMIYGGLVLSCVSALASWNTGLIPMLFVVGSLWGGAEIILGIHLYKDAPGVVEHAESWIPIFMIGYVLLLIAYLAGLLYGSGAAQRSAREILSGSLSPVFYLGVVATGAVAPLTIALYANSSSVGTSPLPYAGIICGLLGDLSMRYCIFRAAFYAPLIGNSRAHRRGSRAER